jgi:hypothetical protein
MTDPNEIKALKASFLGALDTAAALTALASTIDTLDEHGEVSPALLDDLSRVTAAHSVASAALRGLVNTMLARRAVTT